jgi:hypothetical protein
MGDKMQTPINRDVYFVFGSACRLLAGKVSFKEWREAVNDIWSWSVQTTRNHVENDDVPTFVPPPPKNGTDEVLPPPAEKPTQPPSVELVFISDEQLVRLRQHAYQQGFSELGLQRYLKSEGITHPSQITLAKARHIWNAVREPDLVEQYR